MSSSAAFDLPAQRKLALILNGEVVEVMFVPERTGAILESSPIVIDVTDLPTENSPWVGWVYESGKFNIPQKEPDEDPVQLNVEE